MLEKKSKQKRKKINRKLREREVNKRRKKEECEREETLRPFSTTNRKMKDRNQREPEERNMLALLNSHILCEILRKQNNSKDSDF